MHENCNLKPVGDSSVSIVTGPLAGTLLKYPAEGNSFPPLQKILHNIAPSPVMNQWVPGALSPEVKWPGRETDY
jgi:hypothetical protein